MTGRLDGPHACRPDELDGVIALVDAAMRPGSDQSMRTDYPLVYAPGNLPNVQVVTLDGRAIATAPVLPRRVVGDGFAFGMGVISPTATDPEHQHRGYGSACVAACVDRMATLGLELSVLWTRVATFPFYERNGWQAVARSGSSVGLTSVDAQRFPPWRGSIERLDDRPERVAEVLALHAAARPGVVRSHDEGTALWSLPRMTTWLAIEGERVAGYLVASDAVNKPGLLEAVGAEEAIGGLIRQVLERLPPAVSVAAAVGSPPDGLGAAVGRLLPERRPTPSTDDMMVRLNDPAAFLRAIGGWLDADAAWSSASSRLADLTRAALTSLLFGAHPDRPWDIPPELGRLPRFQIPIPVLDRS